MIWPPSIAMHVRRLPLYAFCVLGLLLAMHIVRLFIDFGTDWSYGGGSGGSNEAGPFFDVIGERTVVAWLSASVMVLSALGCMLCFSVLKPHHYRGYWRVLAGVMTYLSIDESVSLHERMTAPMQSAVELGGIFLWAWVIPGALFTTVFAASAIPFLRAIPQRPARLMLLGGALFVTGAVGFEMIGAAITDAGYFHGVWYAVSATIEETLEAAGMILFLSAVTWVLTSDVAPRRSNEDLYQELQTSQSDENS